MNSHTGNTSNLKDSPTPESAVAREHGPIVLLERELEMVAAAGGASGGVLHGGGGRSAWS
jgi:hypothetical protein